MGSLPNYQSYTADHVHCVRYLSNFCTLQTMSVKQHQTLTCASKENIVWHIKNWEKRTTVADKLKSLQSTLSVLLQNKSDIKKKATEKAHFTSQRVRLPAHDDMQESVKWSLDFSARNVPVSGPTLQKRECDSCILSVPNLNMSSR